MVMWQKWLGETGIQSDSVFLSYDTKIIGVAYFTSKLIATHKIYVHEPNFSIELCFRVELNLGGAHYS
jgi:hypothetical protein